MILYGMRASPFVRKAIVVAAEKGIELEVVPAGFGHGGEAFKIASPFAKMPALADGDFTLCDSSAIVAYWEALQPEPAMIPADPRARARTIWYEEFGDTILQPAGVKILFNRMVGQMLGMPVDAAVADAAEAHELPPLMDYVEQALSDDGWLVGDALTLADIAVACPLLSVAYCSELPFSTRWPKVRAWLDRLVARESFAGALAAEKATMGRDLMK